MVLIVFPGTALLLLFVLSGISFVQFARTGHLTWLMLMPVTVGILFFPTIKYQVSLVTNGLVWSQGFDDRWVGLTRSGAAATGLPHTPPFKFAFSQDGRTVEVSFLVSGPMEQYVIDWEHCPSLPTSFGLTQIIPSSTEGCIQAGMDDDTFYFRDATVVRCFATSKRDGFATKSEDRTCSADFVESGIEVNTFLVESDLALWPAIELSVRQKVRQAFVGRWRRS